MGYDINLRLRVFPASQYLPVTAAIEEKFGKLSEYWLDEEDGTYGEGGVDDTRWPGLTEDLKALSRDFPEATIQAFVEGEDGLRWLEWFRNGEHYEEGQPDWTVPEEPVQPERFGNPDLKPYTVIVWYKPEGEAEGHNVYTTHVLGTDANAAASSAVDGLIQDRLGELVPDDMDMERVDYKPIAIYDGHINSLVG